MVTGTGSVLRLPESSFGLAHCYLLHLEQVPLGALMWETEIRITPTSQGHGWEKE